MQNLHRLCSNCKSFCIHWVDTVLHLWHNTHISPLAFWPLWKTRPVYLVSLFILGLWAALGGECQLEYIYTEPRGGTWWRRGLPACWHCCRPGEGNNTPMLLIPLCISDRELLYSSVYRQHFIQQHMCYVSIASTELTPANDAELQYVSPYVCVEHLH